MKLRSGLLVLFASSVMFAQDDPKLSVGVKGGWFVKDLFDSGRDSFSFFNTSPFDFRSGSRGDAREKGYLVGPSVEARLPFRLSAEFDALYSRLNGESYAATFSNGTPTATPYRATANRWEFPVLVKYRIPAGRTIHPFVGAGPSFSLLAQEKYRAQGSSSTINRDPRNFGTGLAITGGVSFGYAGLRFTPEIRYTRRERSTFILPTSQDGVQALVGISFGR